MAGLFQVLWGQPDGSFKKAEVLQGTDGEPLIIPADSNSITQNICTRPMAVDWDSDGDLDLVVGNFAGSFYVFSGKGQGNFLPEPKQIMSGGSPLRISGVHSDPFPIDWDQDGDLDLLSGSSDGGVYWAENTAGKGSEPELESFRALTRAAAPQAGSSELLGEDDLVGPTRSSRVWADDINGDGKLDLLVGDGVTLVSLPEGVSQEESKAKLAQWQKDYQQASQEYSANASDPQKAAAARAKLQDLYSQRSKYIKQEMTGFVWLYLQK